ncbi:hypothetical protein WH87_14875 [Devosia epidermidihirudinis]|uniref:DUF4037 domain-containing protein n=1 Tax=Devosia epidermidihirudinis TaxID=1293439 RepID=A0A0F5Q4P9_9HYPH|nr:DUF4037 domain-containing protein [Devosia epidermidihirudinis]KKC35855.1 hypothetical protein WH87_14875 [Devosia epidermidihirudinis]
MQGIELSRRFYGEIVRPWLNAVAPELSHAAALIGYGSELLGFDDETSRDHNWGPRVHIFVTRDAFGTYGHRLVRDFTAIAPTEFLGEPIGWRNRPHPAASGDGAVGAIEHGLEIHTTEATLRRMLAIDGVNLNSLQWLGLPEQRLLAFTSGAVFHDDDKRLTQLREALAYFPNDIWLYKIACQWRRIAEEQAFVGRAGQVGDDLGSRVIAARLVRDIMRMSFLLERRYAPYSKWFGSAFSKLPLAASLSPLLEQALSAQAWEERGNALAAAYMLLARRQLADGIGASSEPVLGPYHERPFTTINADDLVAASLAGIEDPTIKALPVTGALDQVTDLTPVLEDPAAAQRMMAALMA